MTGGDRIRILDGDVVVGDMPVTLLVDDCPLYDLEPGEPDGWIYGNGDPQLVDSEPSDTLLSLLATPTIASKRWAFEQYDSIVQSRTVRRPEQADAAVLQIPEAGTAIAVSIDGNGRRVGCDPYAGTVEAVLECAQNLACFGAEPLGLTNCLNFGNPEKPAVAWQLERSTRGLADACEELGVPVVGGNVSLYNETERGPIYPTPVVGMVGELPVPRGAADGGAPARATRSPSRDRSRRRWPARSSRSCAPSSAPGLGAFEIGAVKAAIAEVREAVRAGLLHTAHDVSDGGLACALAESAIDGGVGLQVDLGPLLGATDPEAWLFGEGPGGFVLAGEVSAVERLVEAGTATLIGIAAGQDIRIAAGPLSVDVPVADAAAARGSLGQLMEAAPA